MTSIIVMQTLAAGSAYLRLPTTLSRICRTSSINVLAFKRFGSVKKSINYSQLFLTAK